MLEPQVIPTSNGIFNNQPFGSNQSIWGVVVEGKNWSTADNQNGGSQVIDLTGLSAYTLTAEQALIGYTRFIGAPTGIVALTVPNLGRQYIFNNTTAFAINITPYAGSTLQLAAGVVGLYRVDMTQSTPVGVLFAGGGVFPIPGSLISVSADYAVTGVDALARTIIEVDATGGAITITYAPGIAVGCAVTVAKIDTSGNPVIISNDGTTPIDVIVTPANSGNVSSRSVWSNGTSIHSSGVG